MQAIIATRDDEIGCDECFERLDRFVELHLQGKKPEEAMPLVEAHLDMCRDCKEEFEVLLEAINSSAH